MTPDLRARFIGAAMAFALVAVLCVGLELAALEVTGCNAWVCR